MVPKLPSKETLARYGLTADEWLSLAGVECPICDREWGDTVLPVVDHEHVRGWQTMAPTERRMYVRGVICRGCNYFVLTRHGTWQKHRNAYLYLRAYDRGRGRP